VRHAVRLQRIELRQAELQRVKAEQVGDGLVEMALLPLEQDLSHGGPQPLGQLYDRAFRHEPDRTARAHRQLHLDDRRCAHAIVVDPGEPESLAEALDARRLELAAILMTRLGREEDHAAAALDAAAHTARHIVYADRAGAGAPKDRFGATLFAARRAPGAARGNGSDAPATLRTWKNAFR
jgi:hypothetical protein